MKRNEIINYLSQLSESEFAQIVFDSARTMRDERRYESGDFQIDDVFTLASCSFGSFKGKVDQEAIVEVYAPPYDGDISDIGGPITEQGECPLCKTALVSYVKLVKCPVCMTESDLT